MERVKLHDTLRNLKRLYLESDLIELEGGDAVAFAYHPPDMKWTSIRNSSRLIPRSRFASLRQKTTGTNSRRTASADGRLRFRPPSSHALFWLTELSWCGSPARLRRTTQSRTSGKRHKRDLVPSCDERCVVYEFTLSLRILPKTNDYTGSYLQISS